jgi:hypothetical protein
VFFLRITIAKRFGRCKIKPVPLAGNFGDWATPKKSTAGLFLRAARAISCSRSLTNDRRIARRPGSGLRRPRRNPTALC